MKRDCRVGARSLLGLQEQGCLVKPNRHRKTQQLQQDNPAMHEHSVVIESERVFTSTPTHGLKKQPAGSLVLPGLQDNVSERCVR